MIRKRWSAVLGALAAASMSWAAPAGAVAQPTDMAVKAAFLPRFARYVSWPAAAVPRGNDPFVLCVIGDDPFDGLLDDSVRSQSIDGRRIVIKRLEGLAGSDGCQIAFVSGSRSEPAGQLLSALGKKPVLTVTDSGNGGQRGIIHFAVMGGRVRFFIDEAAASARGLSISSRLLALAVEVRQ